MRFQTPEYACEIVKCCVIQIDVIVVSDLMEYLMTSFLKCLRPTRPFKVTMKTEAATAYLLFRIV